jgi:hypothetical protein
MLCMQVHVCGDDSAIDLIQRLCDGMGDTLEVGREGGRQESGEQGVSQAPTAATALVLVVS